MAKDGVGSRTGGPPEGLGGDGFWSSPEVARALLASASQAILAVDAEGRIVVANAKCAETFGYGEGELIGLGVDDLVPEARRAGHARQRQGYFEAPRARSMGEGLHLTGRRKDGTELPVEIALSFVQVGHARAALAFVTDISGRKRLEEQVLQSQRMEAVGRLAGGVAHDFNNMLTVIAGFNRLILDRLSPLDPLRGFAEEVLKATDRSAALTAQLLAFSRRQAWEPRVLNLNTVLASSEKMLRRVIGEDLELHFAPQRDLWNLRADAAQLDHVIVNLALNARDAMPAGGRLTIETANVELEHEYARTHLGVRPGSYVMLAVTDTGVGMDSDTKSQIFEPFFTTKPTGKGTGLGLSTVYGIVKQCGGDVWVYSEPGVGTTFKLYFPRVAEPESDVALAPGATGLPQGTETVLVAEDEAGVRKLLCELLRRWGYRVLEAEHSADALRIGRDEAQGIDLLVSDVVMPDISGQGLAEELGALRPRLKVLLMSGYTENAVVRHGVLSPGRHFLAKPFTPEALARKVREVLDER
ncbi:MAG: PAS domain S-box protein [Polyangiaceae bacterium]|nr:PAS domain S-box protein [Polyangiaceae bacterium]